MIAVLYKEKTSARRDVVVSGKVKVNESLGLRTRKSVPVLDVIEAGYKFDHPKVWQNID